MILLTVPKVITEVIEIHHKRKDGLEILRALPFIHLFVPPNSNGTDTVEYVGRTSIANIDLQLEEFDTVPESKFDLIIDGYDMKGIQCLCAEKVFDTTVLHCSVDHFTIESIHG